MDYILTGRNVQVTDEIRDVIDRRLVPLDRLLGDAVVSATMTLESERHHVQTELIVHARGDHRLHGLGEGTSWPVAVGGAVDKVMQQAQTLKGKWQARRRRSDSAREADLEVPIDSDETARGE